VLVDPPPQAHTPLTFGTMECALAKEVLELRPSH